MEYKVDPKRLTAIPHTKTGIYIRSTLEGKWGAHDLMHLDRDSVLEWLRDAAHTESSRAEETVLVLLGHDQTGAKVSSGQVLPCPLSDGKTIASPSPKGQAPTVGVSMEEESEPESHPIEADGTYATGVDGGWTYARDVHGGVSNLDIPTVASLLGVVPQKGGPLGIEESHPSGRQPSGDEGWKHILNNKCWKRISDTSAMYRHNDHYRLVYS